MLPRGRDDIDDSVNEKTRLTHDSRDYDVDDEDEEEQEEVVPKRVAKLASSKNVTRDPGRILMLHGDAGDDSLMSMLLQASGWAHSVSGIEFVCVKAPHSCPPKPHLFTAFAERGMYDQPSYFTWGFHDAAGASEQRRLLEQSVTHVQALLDEHGCGGVGGICDGSIVAALVAMQTPHVSFVLNCCAIDLLRNARVSFHARVLDEGARLPEPGLGQFGRCQVELIAGCNHRWNQLLVDMRPRRWERKVEDGGGRKSHDVGAC